MNWRYKLLHIDSLGGLSVGLLMLLLNYWLSSWYGLPLGFIVFMALVNIAYGCYSFSLLVRKKRPMSLIVALIIANLAWALLCVYWVTIFAQTASPFGILHLLGEASFVGGLAYVEWRNRDFLLANPQRLKKDAVTESP
jgi:hypothetical protein